MNKKKYEFAIVQSQCHKLNPIEIISKLQKQGMNSNEFIIAKVDNTAIASIFREYILEHGISSNFAFHITCDSILHPGISVSETEKMLLAFIKAIKGARTLYITDPYIYSSENEKKIPLLKRMIEDIGESLERVVFFHLPENKSNPRTCDSRVKTKISESLKSFSQTIEIFSIPTYEFHDRFWIDPENGKGIVIGTSLNGIGKRICLIDYINHNDVKAIAKLADQLLQKNSALA